MPRACGLILILISLGLGPGSDCFSASAKVQACVSILPQKYFVEQIGRDHVQVRVMVAPGASPATYEPKPQQMTALSHTAVYFAIGVPFEKAWLAKIAAANPALRIVHTDQGIAKIPMQSPALALPASDHDLHGHAGMLDPHIWLAPPLVKLQARHILNALCQIDPQQTPVYSANYKAFIQSLDQLHSELHNLFASHQGLAFMVFHPSWGYFAQTYGLVQIPVEMEGKDPKPSQLVELIKFARHRKIDIIFVQPQFSSRSASAVAEAINGHLVIADPLAYDWAANLRRQALEIKVALR
jgi:zinc transport system substrate-binding protein